MPTAPGSCRLVEEGTGGSPFDAWLGRHESGAPESRWGERLTDQLGLNFEASMARRIDHDSSHMAADALERSGPIPLILPALNGTLNGLTSVGHRFVDFTVNKAEIKFKMTSTIDDRFKVRGEGTLAAISNGIDPLNERVIVTVGTSVITIPAGSFTEKGYGKFRFKGTINDAVVRMEIKQKADDKIKFKVEAKWVDLTGTANPIDIGLAIGDDLGKATVDLEGKLKFEAQQEHENDDKGKHKHKHHKHKDRDDDDDDDKNRDKRKSKHKDKDDDDDDD